MSPSFPDSYNNNQNCRMTINGHPSPISVVSFSTEKGTDTLTVNGVHIVGWKVLLASFPLAQLFGLQMTTSRTWGGSCASGMRAIGTKEHRRCLQRQRTHHKWL